MLGNAFFCSLGVFIVTPLTNALRLFAHFFRRKPTSFNLKNKHRFLASFQKNRAPNKTLSAKCSHQFKHRAFLRWIIDEIQLIFL
jgi:hypothetical protein